MNTVFDLDSCLLSIIAQRHPPGDFNPFFDYRYHRSGGELELWVGRWYWIIARPTWLSRQRERERCEEQRRAIEAKAHAAAQRDTP